MRPDDRLRMSPGDYLQTLEDKSREQLTDILIFWYGRCFEQQQLIENLRKRTHEIQAQESLKSCIHDRMISALENSILPARDVKKIVTFIRSGEGRHVTAAIDLAIKKALQGEIK